MFWLKFKDLIIWDIVAVLLIVHKPSEWEILNPLKLHAFGLYLQRQCQVMAAALGNNPTSNQPRCHSDMKANSLHLHSHSFSLDLVVGLNPYKLAIEWPSQGRSTLAKVEEAGARCHWPI